MWIRSQDRKTLVNADKFSVSKEHEVFRIYSVNSFFFFYSTEEKAMKVMDMIEDTILKCEAMRTGYAEYDFGAFVFDMPADKDVEV